MSIASHTPCAPTKSPTQRHKFPNHVSKCPKRHSVRNCPECSVFRRPPGDLISPEHPTGTANAWRPSVRRPNCKSRLCFQDEIGWDVVSERRAAVEPVVERFLVESGMGAFVRVGNPSGKTRHRTCERLRAGNLPTAQTVRTHEHSYPASATVKQHGHRRRPIASGMLFGKNRARKSSPSTLHLQL